MFTRTAVSYSTILDYVVTTRRIDKDIISLTIDEEGDLITGSDHAALVLQMSWTESKREANIWIWSIRTGSQTKEKGLMEFENAEAQEKSPGAAGEESFCP